MVKTVIADDNQSKSAEDRLFQHGIPAQVGLVIGQLNRSSDRGFVYDLIPTPPTDGGGPACSLKSEAAGKDDKKKGSKSGKPSAELPASLVVDNDWVAEHARQVSRMLLGGMNVVGIYLWASEATFKATSPAVFSQAIKGVAQAAPFADNEFEERLLIHVSYSPRRWSCRVCTLASGGLQPCDFKMGKLLASLQAFRCTYNFEIRLPIPQSGILGIITFKDLICRGIANLAKDLQSAKALINGHLVTENVHTSSESPHDVQFLVPFNKHISTEACSSEEVVGLVVFSGAICAFAYMGPREPILQAISDLKSDIVSSLRSRLDIITDEAEEEVALSLDGGGESGGDSLAEKSIHKLALREDVKDHCQEMMSMDGPIETTSVVDPETAPISAATRSFWDVVHKCTSNLVNDSKTNKNSIQREADAGKLERNNLNFLTAILVLLSALLFGWAVVAFGPTKTAY
ncbi:uncharacterized protein LOC135606675 isoform X2 [Musa acuminata AAA Group]|uniref:uncharacterized protein LOC135606675 isoform X2 n=1 Tax=Musa acuminata AAA Group TaxID=214697 RepID=UPI0031E2D458